MPNERILVAEDERDLRRMCLRALEMAGYEAVGVADGREAIDLAQRERFDALVTDIKMPDVGGLEAYEQIHLTCPGLASVVMTGYGTLETAIEAIRLGVYEFVLKPFRPDELTSAVERALARKRLEQENARLNALIPLFDLSRTFMSTVHLDTVPQQVVRIAREQLAADTAYLMLLEDGQCLRIHSAEGEFARCPCAEGPHIGEGTAGRAVLERAPVTVQGDLAEDPWAPCTFGVERVTSAASVPLLHMDKVLGVLNVARVAAAPPLSSVDVELLALLASQAAVAIENARLFREIHDAYDRLAELDHLKSEFLNIAAHELRSPLAVVLAYATLLEDETTGQMRQHLGQVVQASMQLKSIIDSMVSLQHIDTGEARVAMTDIDLAQVVASTLEDVQVLIERKELRVTVDLPADLPPVRGDIQVLHLILGSLLSNACKFTPSQGAVTVTAAEEGDLIAVHVTDTGIGIPEEEQGRIFQRFYQVEDSLRRKHGGIGLGLAIAREMAGLIRAEIGVQSKVNEGSTFTLHLQRGRAARRRMG